MTKPLLPGKAFIRITTIRLALVASAGLGLMLSGMNAARADDYQLGVMDKLKIRVAEWQTAEGTMRDWSVITGDYTIGPSGTVSLPFIGDMPASGKTTGAIAEAIGLELQKQFGLRDRPSASVELAEFRPIYLTGDVDKPGEYPFAPGLTVVKAVSLAGGMHRSDAGQRFARDFINAKGDSDVYVRERARLLARRARLQAEIAGNSKIEMPKDLKDLPDAGALMESESALMQTREKRLKLQLQALADLKSLLESEIESLSKKTDTQSRQLELAKQDRDKIEDLAEKGLALSTRKMQAEQRAADLEATLLDIDTNSLKAKQDISKANQDEITLQNDWEAQLAQELQNTESDLETLALKISTSQDLMSEALEQSADAARFGTNGQTANVAYSIVREVDGQSKEIPVQENTPVLPGDLIRATAGLYGQ